MGCTLTSCRLFDQQETQATVESLSRQIMDARQQLAAKEVGIELLHCKGMTCASHVGRYRRRLVVQYPDGCPLPLCQTSITDLTAELRSARSRKVVTRVAECLPMEGHRARWVDALQCCCC